MTYEEFQTTVEAWASKQPGQIVVDGANEGFFHAPCPCCQRPHAGERFSVSVVASPDSIYGLAVCEDCMFMLLYGHLDWWEGKINTK
jgi:hypothetical protein